MTSTVVPPEVGCRDLPHTCDPVILARLFALLDILTFLSQSDDVMAHSRSDIRGGGGAQADRASPSSDNSPSPDESPEASVQDGQEDATIILEDEGFERREEKGQGEKEDEEEAAEDTEDERDSIEMADDEEEEAAAGGVGVGDAIGVAEEEEEQGEQEEEACMTAGGDGDAADVADEEACVAGIGDKGAADVATEEGLQSCIDGGADGGAIVVVEEEEESCVAGDGSRDTGDGDEIADGENDVSDPEEEKVVEDELHLAVAPEAAPDSEPVEPPLTELEGNAPEVGALPQIISFSMEVVLPHRHKLNLFARGVCCASQQLKMKTRKCGHQLEIL